MNHRHPPPSAKKISTEAENYVSEKARERAATHEGQTTRLAACLAFFFPFFNTKSTAA
jgi:hypothetical protein